MLATPYMLNSAQFDKFNLPYNIGGTTVTGYLVDEWKPSVFAYADAFQAANLGVLASLPTKAQNTSAVFSTGCFKHCVTDSAAFWNVYVNFVPRTGVKPIPDQPNDPVSLRDAMSAWCGPPWPSLGAHPEMPAGPALRPSPPAGAGAEGSLHPSQVLRHPRVPSQSVPHGGQLQRFSVWQLHDVGPEVQEAQDSSHSRGHRRAADVHCVGGSAAAGGSGHAPHAASGAEGAGGAAGLGSEREDGGWARRRGGAFGRVGQRSRAGCGREAVRAWARSDAQRGVAST